MRFLLSYNLLLLIVYAAIIFMTKVLPGFSGWYDQVFLTTPAIKTILYLGMTFFELGILGRMPREWYKTLRQLLWITIAGALEAQTPEAETEEENPAPLEPAETEEGPPDRLTAFAQIIGLTERELEVFVLLLENKSNQQISESLYISTGTVKAHIHNIFQKADVTRRYELLRKYDMFS